SGMDLASEDPAILQLNKWDPSETQVGLSEFREAFISPTREILLLHSYQKEALLFPLVKGDCYDFSYKGLLGLTYSSLHTNINTCKTV
ncbi:hypothetical protein A2U01_0064748, partial [Trifolium medium]|nr:hypothetical protein [Trifolium medium]